MSASQRPVAWAGTCVPAMPKNITVRIARVLRVAAAMIAAGMTLAADAQDYPVRPIRMIVGVPPGATTDILGRLAAAKLGERLGKQVVVDNRPGASGIIGINMVYVPYKGTGCQW